MTRLFHSLVLLLAGLASVQVLAWENHSLAAYRAFENMPEVANAPSVAVEPLEAFVRAEEYTLEALLAAQEAWALVHIEKYPARPAELAFKADPLRSGEFMRLAFLQALRVAPDSRFALYIQSDPWSPESGIPLAVGLVSTLPEGAGSGYRYLALKPDEQVAALSVLATATDEPDLGLDARLFEDNGSEWGKRYGFGRQPYGDAMQVAGSQAPFHTGFMHESRLVTLGFPAIQRSLVLFRSHQFATLAALAFRTGHSYWGWRFAGLSLHYLQELTQPYHAALAPGESDARLLGVQALAFAGMAGMKRDLLQLQASRCRWLEKYQNDALLRDAANRLDSPLEKALHAMDKDKVYPEWNDRYPREVVTLQASRAAPALTQVLVAAQSLNTEGDERLRLDTTLAELLGNFASHSRNALRAILRASDPL